MIYLKEGNIPLNFAYNDEIVQEANSTYQLRFRFPVDNPLWENLTEETLLLADDLHGEQEFVIFEIERQHSYVSVYANQVATLLNNYSISELNVDRVDGYRVMSTLAGSIIRNNNFSFTSDIRDKHSLNIKKVSVATVLFKDSHSIIGQWGGDLVRDKYDIRLLKNGGSDNESLFMYKKNLKTYQQKKSMKDLRTRIHFTKTITENDIDKVISVTVDSPLINKYKNIYEGDLEVSDQDVVDEASLLNYAKQYYKNTLCDVVEENIEIDVIGEADVPVKMFDTVNIFHEKFNLDVKKKISKYTFSPMSKKLKTIGFGKVQQSFSSALSGIVNDTVSKQTSRLADDIDARVEKELKNADLAFTRQVEGFRNELTDGIERAKAKAEQEAGRIATEVDDEINKFKKHVEETLKDFNKDLNIEEFNKKIEELKKNISSSAELNKKFDELKKEILADTDSDMDEIRKKLSETSDKVIINTNMIGGDGKTYYNKNRVKGATDRLIALGTPYIEIEHNGDGFEVGKDYTISWQAVCNVKPHGDIDIIFNKKVYDSVNLNFSPRNIYYPRITKNLTANGKVLTVYFDTYSITYEGNFYKNSTISKNIDRSTNNVNLGLSYKEFADVLDNATEIVWNENSDLIFDGGNN